MLNHVAAKCRDAPKTTAREQRRRKADVEMTSSSGDDAAKNAQMDRCGDTVRPRRRVEELLAGGENVLALPLAKHEPRTAATTCNARGWSQPSAVQMAEEVAGPL